MLKLPQAVNGKDVTGTWAVWHQSPIKNTFLFELVLRAYVELFFLDI